MAEIDIKFKITGNNEIWQSEDEKGDEREFKAEMFSTNVEKIEIDGKVIDWVQVRLSYFKDHPSGDPMKKKGMVDIPNFEWLGKPESIGKEFTILMFDKEALNDPITYEEIEDTSRGEKHGDLNLGRSQFYNISFNITGPDKLEKEWKIDIPSIESLEPKADDKDFNEMNDKIKGFNEALRNNFYLNRFISLYDSMHSFGRYGVLQKKLEEVIQLEIDKEGTDGEKNKLKDFLVNFKNKSVPEVYTEAERKTKFPHEASWWDYIAVNSKYKEHIDSRKKVIKNYSTLAKKSIDAAKKIVVELEKAIKDWRAAGGIVDTDYNKKLLEFEKTKSDIIDRYNKLKDKIKKKDDNLQNSWATEISKLVGGVSAEEDLGVTPPLVEKVFIDKYINDDRQVKKEENKIKLKKSLKILARKRAVVEEFESKMGDGPDQNNIPQLISQATTNIQTELDRDPKVVDSELGQYSNWRTEIAKLDTKDKIDSFESKLINAIQGARVGKQGSNKLKQLIAEAKTKDTYEELETILGQISDFSETPAYQENKAEIDDLEKKLQSLGSGDKYAKTVQDQIKKKLSELGLQEQDLSPETKKNLTDLKENKISDQNKLRQIKTETFEDIGKTDAEQKIISLTNLVNSALNSGKENEIAAAKVEVDSFITKSGNNDYYKRRITDATALLAKLANPNHQDGGKPTTNPGGFPWKIVVPIILLVVLVVVVAVVMVWKKGKEVKEEE